MVSHDDAIPEEARKLQTFVGHWDVEGVMIARDDRLRISGRWSFDEAADGWAVSGSLTTTIEGTGSIQEHELIGLNPSTGRIHMFSMNRLAIRDHIGGWEGDTLVTRFVSDEGATVEEIRLRFPDQARMEGSVSEHSGGRLVLTTELALGRRSQP